MKDNRLTRSDIDKIRRRLDLLLKDCARYMKKEQSDYFDKSCDKTSYSLCDGYHHPEKCTMKSNHLDKLFTLLKGIGIYDTGVRPPTIPKELRRLHGRIRIFPAPKIITYPLPQKRT